MPFFGSELNLLDEKGQISQDHYGEIFDFIKSKSPGFIEHIETAKEEDHSVYTGKSGKLITLIKIYYVYSRNEAFVNDKVLEKKFLKTFKKGMTKLKSKASDFSFHFGPTGPFIMKSYFYRSIQFKKSKSYAIKSIKIYNNKRKKFQDKKTSDELINGRAGYLYSLIYLKRNLGHDIPVKLVEEVCLRIVESTVESFNSFISEMEEQADDPKYIESCRDFIRILYLLLDPICLETFAVNQAIKDIQSICSQIFNGMFPDESFELTDMKGACKFYQWCCLGPEAIYLSIRCKKIFKESKYYQVTDKLGEFVWKYGLCVNSSRICRGAAGNAYALLALYNHYGDIKYLYYAIQFAKWIVQQPDEFHIDNIKPYSLYDGLAGTLYFLCDLFKPKLALLPGLQTIVD